VANHDVGMCLGWVRRTLKKSFMGRGFPVAIAILWIGSLIANAVTQVDAGADKAPGRVSLAHLQPLHVSPTAAAESLGRTGVLKAPLPTAQNGSRGTQSLFSTRISSERFLVAVVQAAPYAIWTKPGLPANPRNHALLHERTAGHPKKASSPRLAAAGPAHSLQVWVTGYDLYGVTATGVPAGPGICAVDPNTIPLGTHIAVSGVGTCVAADTGPAVVGAHIDVWVPDYQSAINLTGWYTATW